LRCQHCLTMTPRERCCFSPQPMQPEALLLVLTLAVAVRAVVFLANGSGLGAHTPSTPHPPLDHRHCAYHQRWTAS
jgi:hypothetical protein